MWSCSYGKANWEGCSEKSLKYYKATIEAMLDELNKDVKHIVTDDIEDT